MNSRSILSWELLLLLGAVACGSSGSSGSSGSDDSLEGCITEECLPAVLTDIKATKSYRSVGMTVSVRHVDGVGHVSAGMIGQEWIEAANGPEVRNSHVGVHIKSLADQWTMGGPVVVRSDENEEGMPLALGESGQPLENRAVAFWSYDFEASSPDVAAPPDEMLNPPGELTLTFEAGVASGSYRAEDGELLYELSAPLELICFPGADSSDGPPADLSTPPCSDWKTLMEK